MCDKLVAELARDFFSGKIPIAEFRKALEDLGIDPSNAAGLPNNCTNPTKSSSAALDRLEIEEIVARMKATPFGNSRTRVTAS